MIHQLIRPSLCLTLLLVSSQSSVWAAAGCDTDGTSATKPNIVVVLFDDMGWAQPQCYNPESALRTPHLDSLAAHGMRFTDAHAAAAVCTPTRYGLLTGRHPSRAGQFGVLTTYSRPIIPAERMTIASLLKQQGYHTACVGKWHLGMNWVNGRPGRETEVPIGETITDGPNALGFDYFCGFTHARNIGTILEQQQVVANVRAEDNQPLMIAKAVQWIDQQTADAPFFLYFPMCPPHTPIAPSDDYVGISQAHDVVRQDPRYGDWLYQGDAMLGRIVAALSARNLLQNTLIIATSDNGAEQRAYEPLRESKRSIYEGGHRVPFVASWPGRIPPGTVCSQTICLNDVMATAADIVGISIPPDAAEDSFSLLPLLQNPSADIGRRPGTIHQSPRGDLAIRLGPWKLIFHSSGHRELFQLERDLQETSDVLKKHPQIVDELTRVMQLLIDNGRSTTGSLQQNDVELSISQTSKPIGTRTGKKRKNSRD